jgi:hypothetical protein
MTGEAAKVRQLETYERAAPDKGTAPISFGLHDFNSGLPDRTTQGSKQTLAIRKAQVMSKPRQNATGKRLILSQIAAVLQLVLLSDAA